MNQIGYKILNWYYKNQRDLPWRKTKNPYNIWVSEIILQQTRIDQGKDYYIRFIERFPNIISLANAQEVEVLRYWQGLGYYSRARNLHFSAKLILKKLNGIFPNKYEDLIKLKGIGPYTAAAIASISFDLPYSVVDGNVMRAISRLKGLNKPINTSEGRNYIKKNLDEIFIRNQSGDFNQAIMEFGAIICKPKNPLCDSCVLINECVAFKKGIVNNLPNKTLTLRPKDLFIYYFVIFDKLNKTVYLRKRRKDGIWKNLYDFPSFDSEKKITANQLYKKNEFTNLFLEQNYEIYNPEKLKHKLTHRTIFASFFPIIINNILMSHKKMGLSAVNLKMLREKPVSRLIDIYFTDIFFRQFTPFF